MSSHLLEDDLLEDDLVRTSSSDGVAEPYSEVRQQEIELPARFSVTYQDIDFDSSPDFSSHYLLRGPEEMAIRSAMSADALSFFGQHQDWHVEVKDRTVAIYRAGKRCKPEDFQTFFAEAQDVLRVLVPG